MPAILSGKCVHNKYTYVCVYVYTVRIYVYVCTSLNPPSYSHEHKSETFYNMLTGYRKSQIVTSIDVLPSKNQALSELKQ